jgi:lysophospholipase L1-like esterase
MAISEKHLPAVANKSNALFALLNKPARTILLVTLFASLPLLIPALRHRISVKGQNYSEVLPNVRELVSFKEHSASATTLPSCNDTTEQPSEPETVHGTCGDQLIQDPDHAMDSFNAALARTEAKEKGAITRVSHYGDSPITNDGITGTVRDLLQEKFGDSGHGFILIDRPWDWYGHQAITFSSGGGWLNGSFMNPRTRDGEFGLGGVAFFASGPGRYARFEPAREGATGKKFSRLEVYYLAQPNGGQFSLTVDEAKTQIVSTASDQPKSEFCEIKASESSARSFALKTLDGNVRVFGAVLENDDPGVVYDSLGVNGAFAGLLATAMNEPHWAEQLQHRRPNLVILNYGTNESEYASDDQMQRYERDLHEVVRRVRTALPEASILIVSPMDRGKRAPGGRIITLPSIPKIVNMQRRVALDMHCAFLNTFAAMGGEGTMARWHEGRQHLVAGDLTHPTATGAQTIGTLIYMALMENYNRYTDRMATSATQKNRTRKS